VAVYLESWRWISWWWTWWCPKHVETPINTSSFLHLVGYLFTFMINYIIFSNRIGSVITTCSIFKLQRAACPLSQPHIFITHLFKIHFNIILLLMSLYPKLSLTFEFSDRILHTYFISLSLLIISHQLFQLCMNPRTVLNILFSRSIYFMLYYLRLLCRYYFHVFSLHTLKNHSI
jgi:hypothetical protein